MREFYTFSFSSVFGGGDSGCWVAFWVMLEGALLSFLVSIALHLVAATIPYLVFHFQSTSNQLCIDGTVARLRGTLSIIR